MDEVCGVCKRVVPDGKITYHNECGIMRGEVDVKSICPFNPNIMTDFDACWCCGKRYEAHLPYGDPRTDDREAAI